MRKSLVLQDEENTNQQNFHGFKTKLQGTFWCLLEQFHQNKTFFSPSKSMVGNVLVIYSKSKIQNFLFLYIPVSIHRNFRNWHQLFYNRSGSCNIPIDLAVKYINLSIPSVKMSPTDLKTFFFLLRHSSDSLFIQRYVLWLNRWGCHGFPPMLRLCKCLKVAP